MSTTTFSKREPGERSAQTLPRLEPESSLEAEPQQLPPARRRGLGRRFFLLLLVLGAVAWGVRVVQHRLSYAETDDAYLTSYVHPVNAHVAGTIVEVLVAPNAEVKAGQVLFRLDPRDHEAKVRQSEAQLTQSDAVIKFTKAQIDETHAKVDLAQAQLTKAENDFKRSEELSRTKVASTQELDAARAAVDSARANVVSANATALGMESGLKVAEAQRENSQASLDNARLQLSYNVVVAPVAGRTSKRNGEVGAYVQPGQTLIAIVEPEVWVEANFKETQLAKMRLGQRVELAVDALPGQRFVGRIESFSPASGAQFAMLPPDNATGNFTKVVQRVPVRINFDPGSIRGFEDRLRAGLSVVADVETR